MTKHKVSTLPGKAKPSAAEQRAEDSKQHTPLWDRPGFLIRRLHQIHVAVFLEEIAEDNITPVQFGLLSVLSDSPGLDQLSLAEELGIDRANVADVLNRLETRGLVKRVSSTEDKRRKLCTVTPEGLAFVRKHFANMRRAQERMLSPLNAQERVEFMRMIQLLVDANNDLGRAPLRRANRPAEAEPLAPEVKKRGARARS